MFSRGLGLMNENRKAADGFSLFARYTLILSVIEAAAFSAIIKCEPVRFIMACVVVLVLDIVFLVYSYVSRFSLFQKGINYIIVAACYLLSLAFVFLYGLWLSVPVFILIPCIAVIFTNAPLGIILQSLLLSLCAFLRGSVTLEFVQIYISGVVLSLVITLVNNVFSLVVASVLCPVIDLCISFAISGAITEEMFSTEFFVSVAVRFVILLLAFLMHRLVLKKVPEDSGRDLLFDIESKESQVSQAVSEPKKNTENEFDLESFAAANQEKEEKLPEPVSEQNVTPVEAAPVMETPVEETPDQQTADGEDQPIDIGELLKHYEFSLETCVSDEFPYVELLRNEYPKLYRHCFEVAEYASYAADLIGCDKMLAFAYGVYHEVKRIHGIDEDLYGCLMEKYHLPPFFLKSLVDYSEKRKMPMYREVGIAALVDDTITMRNYLRARKEEINSEKVVSNVIRVRKNQKLLESCGLSETEVEIVGEYLREIL